MTRTEIIDQFRQENPEITSRVITNTVLNSWLLEGNQNVCIRARCIRKSATAIASVAEQAGYNLADEISDFFDISEHQDGGIAYDDDRLEERTKAWLDEHYSSWRTASSGTPKHYYRYMNYIYLYPKPDTSDEDIDVDYVAIPADFDSNVEPFNQIKYLSVFSYSLVKWLKIKAKQKIGKPQDAANAMLEYEEYIKFMKKTIGGYQFGEISFRPKSGMYNP